MSDQTSILPPNRTPTEAALEQAIRAGKPDLTPIAKLMNPDTCPAEHLGWLAWAFSVDIWEVEWSEDRKRDVIRKSIQVHRIKGTRGSVRRALGSIGFRTDISEWFEYGGAPHTFRIDAFSDAVFEAGFQIDETLLETVTRLIENLKPVRSHFELRIGESFQGRTYARTAVRERSTDQLTQTPQPRAHKTEGQMFARTTLRERAVSRLVHDARRRRVWHAPMRGLGKLYLLLLNGQSNSVGATSGLGVPIVSYVITKDALYPTSLFSFSGGVRPHQEGSTRDGRLTPIDPARLTGLIPATEGAPSVTQRESIAVAAAEVLAGPSGFDESAPVLVYSGGHGGCIFSELVIDNGIHSVPWRNMKLAVSRAYQEAEELGLQLEIIGFIYNGNEGNYHEPKETWLANCATLRAAVDDLAESIGQESRVPLILCQIGVPHKGKRTVSPVTIGSQEFAADPSNYTVAAPLYWVTVGQFPSVHYISPSHRLLGEKLGFMLLDMIHGEDTQVRMISAAREGAKIRITYSHDLVADTNHVTDPGDLGIRLSDEDGKIEITAPAIDGPHVTFDLTRWPVGTLTASVACDNHTEFEGGSGLGNAFGQRASFHAAHLRHRSTSQPDLMLPDWPQHQQIAVTTPLGGIHA